MRGRSGLSLHSDVFSSLSAWMRRFGDVGVKGRFYGNSCWLAAGWGGNAGDAWRLLVHGEDVRISSWFLCLQLVSASDGVSGFPFSFFLVLGDIMRRF